MQVGWLLSDNIHIIITQCYVYTRFPADTAATFEATVEKTGWTWGNAGGRDGQTWEAVIAVIAVPDFKTVKKFASAVTVRIRNLAGRSKTGWTQQNVTKRDSA